jgi:hypothetical protein
MSRVKTDLSTGKNCNKDSAGIVHTVLAQFLDADDDLCSINRIHTQLVSRYLGWICWCRVHCSLLSKRIRIVVLCQDTSSIHLIETLVLKSVVTVKKIIRTRVV